MKSFLDPNTKLEQEKLNNARVKFRVEFFRQYANPVKSANSINKEFVVDGEVTWLSINDTLFFPLDDFETVYAVSLISYNSTNQESTITLSTFPTNDIVGKEFAKRYTVQGGEKDRVLEIGQIRFDTEGEALNQFLAGSVNIRLANGDRFFRAKNDSGIFDADDIFWLRLYVGYANATDQLLYFGGLLDIGNAFHNPQDLTVEVTVYGHEKELERYPAFLLSEPFGRFLQLSGFTMLSVTAGERTREGISSLKYVFNETEIKGITIKEIDKETPAGIRSLKFRPPGRFRYHDGDWTTLAEDTDDLTLQDAGGYEIKVDTDDFDIQAQEVFLIVTADELKLNKSNLEKTGVPELQFGGGKKQPIETDFFSIYVKRGGIWFDLSADNEKHLQWLAFSNTSDEVYLFAEEPFFGIDLSVSSSLATTLVIEYSSGFNVWQPLTSFSDTTSDLSQSGSITWSKTDAAAWRSTTLEVSGVEDVSSRFAIRIKTSGSFSGACVINHLSKRFRLYAADDTILDLKVDLQKISLEEIAEELVIRQLGGIWQPCTWYSNISDEILLKKALAAAQFSVTQQALDSLQVTTTEKRINVWGEVPLPFYGKKSTAIFYDESNSRLWVGVEDEIWYHENGEFTYLLSIPNTSIRRLSKTAAGNIRGAAWYSNYNEYNVGAEDPDGLNFKTVLFECNTSGLVDSYSPTDIPSMEFCIRRGGLHSGVTTIGVGVSNVSGENIVIPFPQIIKNWGSKTALVAGIGAISGLLGTNGAGTNGFNFGTGGSSSPKGQLFSAAVGHYKVTGGGNLYLDMRFRLGQSAFMVWNGTHEDFLCYQFDRDSGTRTDNNIKIVRQDVAGGSPITVWDIANSNIQPLAAVNFGGPLHISMMHWDDGDPAVKSKNTLERIAISSGTYARATYWDSSTDSAANSSQSIYNREENQVVLDLAINPTEGTVHGCMLDRDNYEYHYFVEDNGSFYSTQTGSNFTFDRHHQLKNFAVLNGKTYVVAVDTRYRTDSAYLIEVSYANGAITLTKIATIVEGDFDHQQLIADNNSLFGITGSGVVWQYSDSFETRTEYAKLGDGDLREVVNEIAKKLNVIWTIRPQRKFLLKQRSGNDGSMSLHQNLHIVKINPTNAFEHKYDGVKVSWRSLVSAAKGEEEYGVFGWHREILSLSGNLIQNRHIAQIVAEKYGSYFTNVHRQISLETIALIQLEQADRVNLFLDSNRYDVDSTKNWILNSIEFDPETLVMIIKGVS